MRIAIILNLLMLFVVTVSLAQESSPCEPTNNRRAEKLFQKALDEMSKGNRAAASEVLLEAVEEEPEYYEAHFLQGYINVMPTNAGRRVALAIPALEKVVAICPSHENYYASFYLGRIYFGQQNWAGAEKHLTDFEKNVKPMELSPDNKAEARKAERENKRIEKDIDEAEQMLIWARFYNKVLNDPKPFSPVPVKGVSSGNDEYLAIISPDNELSFYTRRTEVKAIQGGFTRAGVNYKENFMVSKRSNGVFDDGNLMPYPFNVGLNQGGVSVTIDNKYLYLTVCKPAESGTYVNCDIYYSVFSYGEWSELIALGPNVNTSSTWESQPTISSDGKTLFFVSDREGGYGGTDIYKSIKGSNEEWGPAINLGPAVNTAGDESTPFIHTDSQTLYFSSGDRVDENNIVYPGHMGLGKKDIFYYRFNSDPPWTKPVNIGYPINSPEDDIGFFVSTDGHYGYLASNKLKGIGGWDIYSFDLYPEARPEKVLFIKGELTDEKTSAPVREATIEIKNVESRQITHIPVDQETGKYVVVLPFRNDYIMTVKSREHAYQTVYIAQRNTKYEIPVKVDFEVKPLEVGATYPLRDIYFGTNSDSLTNESKMVIDGFIDFLRDNIKVHVAIHGHTDDIGSDAANLLLSEKRARAVMNYIVEKGISASRLASKGFGESKPIADNKTEEGRAKNRRTEFVLIRK